MFEANNIVVNCPSCNTPLPVLLIQVATQQVIICSHCKNEFRLLDKDGKAKRAISESYPAWNTIR
jgi:transposase-like protein